MVVNITALQPADKKLEIANVKNNAKSREKICRSMRSTYIRRANVSSETSKSDGGGLTGYIDR